MKVELLGPDRYYVFIITNKDNTRWEAGITGYPGRKLEELEALEDDQKNCTYFRYLESFDDGKKAMKKLSTMKQWPKSKIMTFLLKVNPDMTILNRSIAEMSKSLLL